ncbi:MAG: hypothetical protein OXG41_13535 [Acidimicrobiaceae bacterium]|nr:hypothetical protein [Acidimicrobiaceae bacterium]
MVAGGSFASAGPISPAGEAEHPNATSISNSPAATKLLNRLRTADFNTSRTYTVLSD